MCQPQNVIPDTRGRFPAARIIVLCPSTSTTSNSFAARVITEHLPKQAPLQIPVQMGLGHGISNYTTRETQTKPNYIRIEVNEVGVADVRYAFIFLVDLDTVR